MSNKISMFDDRYYIEINEARWSMAEGVLDRLKGIERCFDVGCGPGWFSERLAARGLNVWGVDGRPELAEAAASRVPEATFSALDITDQSVDLGGKQADLVFCFGLLYHLENPFAAIRNLFRMTEKYLFVETQVAPGKGNDLIIISEGRNHTQGLHFHAIVPSRNELLKMFYVAGFSSVHRYVGTVDHSDFVDSGERLHRREIFMVTRDVEFSDESFVHEPDPTTPKIDYSI